MITLQRNAIAIGALLNEDPILARELGITLHGRTLEVIKENVLDPVPVFCRTDDAESDLSNYKDDEIIGRLAEVNSQKIIEALAGWELVGLDTSRCIKFLLDGLGNNERGLNELLDRVVGEFPDRYIDRLLNHLDEAGIDDLLARVATQIGGDK